MQSVHATPYLDGTLGRSQEYGPDVSPSTVPDCTQKAKVPLARMQELVGPRYCAVAPRCIKWLVSLESRVAKPLLVEWRQDGRLARFALVWIIHTSPSIRRDGPIIVRQTDIQGL